MSRPLIVLLICVALVGGIFISMGGETLGPEPQKVTQQEGPTEPTQTAQDKPVVMQREDARGFEPASLQVTTKNPSGVQLADATVTLTLENKDVALNGSGVHKFPTLTAGTWELLVEHPEFIEHRETIELAPGAKEQIVVRLYPDMRITGTIKDRFGRKQVGQYIWFLRLDEKYPMRMRRASKLLGAQVNAGGSFVAHVPADVPLRMVVGLPDKPRWEDTNLTTIKPGDPQHLDLVIGGTTRTRVVVQGAELERSERRSMFSLAIQTSKKVQKRRNDQEFLDTYDSQTKRQVALGKQQESLKRARELAAAEEKKPFEEFQQDPDADSSESQAPRGGRLKRMREERLKKRRERIAAGLPPESKKPQEDKPLPPPVTFRNDNPSGLVWQTMRQEACPLTGELTFHNLPTGQDLRLRVVRRIESLNSEAIFRALPDVTQVLEFQMPGAKSSRPEGAAPPVISFSRRMENLPEDAPKAGATWKQ